MNNMDPIDPTMGNPQPSFLGVITIVIPHIIGGVKPSFFMGCWGPSPAMKVAELASELTEVPMTHVASSKDGKPGRKGRGSLEDGLPGSALHRAMISKCFNG